MSASGDEASDVSDVRDQDGADLSCYRGEAGEVDRAGDRCPPAEDQPGPLAQRQVPHLVKVDPARLGP